MTTPDPLETRLHVWAAMLDRAVEEVRRVMDEIKQQGQSPQPKEDPK